MIWFLLGLMSIVAIGFAVWPLSKEFARQRLVVLGSIVFVAAGSAAMYAYTGSPNVPSGAGQQPDVGEMVASLAARLEKQPNDVAGWKMLGRSYATLGNLQGAVDAYQRAVDLENAQNPDTLMRLGVSMAQADGETLSPRAVAAIENALALDPRHREALFYGGMAAANRGDPSLAAERWERLLESAPPEDVRPLLEQRVAEWRGLPPPAPASSAETTGHVVTVTVGLSDEATAALPEQASVFIIARDPNQPRPPIAVTRRQLSELPATVGLGDRESMIPGRNLSAFPRFEVLVRVSVSGNPAEQPGDWFASAIVEPAASNTIELSVNQQVE